MTLTLRELVAKARAWCAANHAGETQHGHHGLYIGKDNAGNSLCVSCRKGSCVWLNISSPELDKDGTRQFPAETLEQLRQFLVASGLTVTNDWACASHMRPAHSLEGYGWKVHPTSIKLCKPIGLGKKPAVL